MSTEQWRRLQDSIRLLLSVITNIILQIYQYRHLNDAIYHFEQICLITFFVFKDLSLFQVGKYLFNAKTSDNIVSFFTTVDFKQVLAHWVTSIQCRWIGTNTFSEKVLV